jgi:LmbE family N-acetylglucosaminyl deacetylase
MIGAALILSWGRWLFREPGTRRVPSLIDQLGARSLLAVFAHPDDEIDAAGLLADAGRRRHVTLRLITTCRGDRGISSTEYPASSLGRVREAEVRRHGAALGVSQQEVWSYTDGALSSVPERELVGRLMGRLRSYEPDMVLTYDPAGGFTAHPDHRRIGETVRAAFCAAGALGYRGPRWLVYVVAPRRVARRFGGDRGRRVAEVEPVPEYAVARDTSLPLRGWKIHRSQRDYLRRATGVPPWLLYRLERDELFVVLDRAAACGTHRVAAP